MVTIGQAFDWEYMCPESRAGGRHLARFLGSDGPVDTDAYQRAFPSSRPIAAHIHKQAPGHVVRCDPTFSPECGWLSVDEAALLARLAAVVGGNWLEVGANLAWSACHLALGCDEVTALDVEYARAGQNNRTGDAGKFFAEARANARRFRDEASLLNLAMGGIAFVGASSRQWSSIDGGAPFSGAHIDGDHNSPHPLEDAKLAESQLAPRGLIVFHDGAAAPVREAVAWLTTRGFVPFAYETPAMLTVCARGVGFGELPEHTPDAAAKFAAAYVRSSPRAPLLSEVGGRP